MENQTAAPDSYKEAVGGYYQQGIEVVPPQAKPFDGQYQDHHHHQQEQEQQAQHAYYQGAQGYPTPAPEPTIFGMRRATFFLSLALVAVIIIAGVGGGVGGTMAVENARKSANSAAAATVTVTTTVTASASASGTTTPTPTSFGEPLSVPTGVVKSDCPNVASEVSIGLGSDSWVFQPSCGVDYNGGDFGAIIAYSFHDCLQACAAHNHFSGKDVCNAVSFKANQTASIPKDYGNCWLKSGYRTIYSIPDGPSGTKDMSIGAVLKGKMGE